MLAMPVNIYKMTPDGQDNETIAWLCDDSWQLPDQAEALAAWLTKHRATLPPADYIADIGFEPREDAFGGGAAFPPETLRMMAELGITLFLSEYPANEKP